MMKCEWILCPVCGSKTRNKIRKDTVLENYPLYCPKCRQERYPAIYKGVSTAEGKTFSFNRGEKQNRYITNDAEEIKILRDYIKTRVDNMFTEVKE